MLGPESRGGIGQSRPSSWSLRSKRFRFLPSRGVKIGGNELPPLRAPRAARTTGTPECSVPAGRGAQGRAVSWGRPDAARGSRRVGWAKPEKAPTCAAARSERGAEPGLAGALGQPGDGLAVRGVHREGWLRASSRRRPGGAPPLTPASSPPRRGNSGSRGSGRSNRHGGAAEEEAEEEEVFARGSRFLLPGWASVGGGEGRAAAGISRLGPQGPERGTRCPLLTHCAT